MGGSLVPANNWGYEMAIKDAGNIIAIETAM